MPFNTMKKKIHNYLMFSMRKYMFAVKIINMPKVLVCVLRRRGYKETTLRQKISFKKNKGRKARK